MRLSLAFLGAFEVSVDGRPIQEFRAQSVRALLTYLALEANRPHEREHLCALLWPDDPLPTALTNLRQALHRLRQALEPAAAEGAFLSITRQTVQLNAATIASDVAELRAVMQAVSKHVHRSATRCAVCAARIQAVLPLYRGELLPGFSLEHSAPSKIGSTPNVNGSPPPTANCSTRQQPIRSTPAPTRRPCRSYAAGSPSTPGMKPPSCA